MNRILRIACYGFLILLAGCSSLQQPIDADWINRIFYTPTPAPVIPAAQTPTLAPAPETTADATPDTTTEPTILHVWLPPQFNPNTTNSNSSMLLKQRLANFEAEHPGLVINVRIKSEEGEANLLNSLSVTSMAAPNALPDLVALPRPALESAVQKGLVHPLEGNTNVPETNSYPYARELGKVEGTTYGIPFAGDALVIMYRPELVWIKNWDGILLSESQLVFAGADPQAQVALALYVSAGGQLQDAQGKPMLDQETLTRTLELFARGRSATIFPEASVNLASDAQVMQEYRARRAEMAIAHYSQYRPSQDGLMQSLMGLEAEHKTFATGWVWATAAQSPASQQLALELAEYLTADEFLSQWIDEAGYLPTRSSVLDEENQDTVVPIIQAAELVPSNDVLLTLGPLMQEAVTRVLNGEQPDAVSRSVIEKLR